MKSLPVIQDNGQLRAPGHRSLWQSVGELESRAAAQRGEFAAGAAEAPPELSRRSFMQILGASAALGGLAACQPPREKIVPYVYEPPEDRPGKRFHFATALAFDGYATGLLVGAADGRPVKVEGNPAHPASLGASSTWEQGTLLDLYDPARARGIWRKGEPLSWRGFLAEIQKLARVHDADGGARLAFLIAPDASPTQADLRRRIQARFPKARFHAWAPVTEENAAEGARIAFGRPLDVRHSLEAARAILSLDADFLSGHGESLRLTREFARHREPGAAMSRLYVAEPALSLTGANADHRFRMRGTDVAGFARAVAAHLGVVPAAPALSPELARAAKAVAADLAAHRGQSVVLVGERQPPAVHALAHAVNAFLGNVGVTVNGSRPVLGDAAPTGAALAALAKEIEGGKVDTLVITAWNPVYAAPAGLDVGGLLSRVPNALYLSLREDETSRRCSWKIAASHPFETWGDGRSRDGIASLVQPLIAPLYESVSPIDLFAAFLDQGDKGAMQHVKAYWMARSGTDPVSFEGNWERWLRQGIVPGTAEGAENPPVDVAAVTSALGRLSSGKSDGLELALAPSYGLFDGRFAANAWLQELPDPITKVTWDNAAYLSETTARKLGVADGQVATLAIGARNVQAPVKVMPGHADDSVTLALGYGRADANAVSKGVGVDAYRLREGGAWFVHGLSVTAGKGKHTFAIAQGHFGMEGRPLALDFTAKDWREGEGGGELEHLRGMPPTSQPAVDYSKQEYSWGMSIDLSRCTGCNACVIACQEENNIATVGKEQVAKGRIMHWLRTDRYFSGTASDPETITQPVMCQHCETAPCEYVCPVNATVHSDEGLNEMVYNRCVGTRYCSNNCPYKVRRFNFLNWRPEVPAVETLLFNPDVTVRSRGVMEKCTYCVQRIEGARIDARVGGKKIGFVQSACQQACPAEAIVFGNLNDPQSRVKKLHEDARRYDLLHELGTRPRTAYLVRIRNPNPDLA
jgi:molybdopterin-containing oxidoreductase family iron-sulfur binding subunit